MSRRNFQAGQFNKLVTIEQLDTTQSAMGSPATTWSAFATWWCRMQPITGSEAFSSSQVEAKAQYELVGNRLNGVNAKMRVNDHGTYYDIQSPPLFAEERSQQYMTLLVKYGPNNG